MGDKLGECKNLNRENRSLKGDSVKEWLSFGTKFETSSGEAVKNSF